MTQHKMYRSVDDQTITNVVDVSDNVIVVIVAGVSMSVSEECLNAANDIVSKNNET